MTTSPITSIEPQFRTIDGLKIRYADSGGPTAPVALLTSPWPESIYAFTPMWETLAEHARRFAIDLPGRPAAAVPLAAVALLEQAKSSDGNLGADALAEAHNAWWSCTAWRDHASRRLSVDTDPHKVTEGRLDDWCDEATFGDWEQEDARLPDWQTAHQDLVADGVSAALTNASAANESRAFPPPVETS
jgi:hypothetical protein